MRARHVCVLVALSALTACGGGGGGGGTGPTDPGTGGTAAERTAQGWARFVERDFAAAITEFQAAIVRDADFGEAHLGLGWSRLNHGTSDADLDAATSSFDAAAARGVAGAATLAGRAASRLGRGVALDVASADAQTALTTSPQFQFVHRPSVDRNDLLLLRAFAEAGRGNLAAALAAADQIQSSGITSNDASSWVVQGVTLPTFEAAVLARLHQLSESHAG